MKKVGQLTYFFSSLEMFAFRIRVGGNFPFQILLWKGKSAIWLDMMDGNMLTIPSKWPMCYPSQFFKKKYQDGYHIHNKRKFRLLLFVGKAAAAKSHQSCPTLCDPIDGSPPGSPVPGILQARALEWVATAFSSVWKWKVKGKSLSRIRLLVTPWTAAYQAPPSMGFSRQEYWSGVPSPSLVGKAKYIPSSFCEELFDVIFFFTSKWQEWCTLGYEATIHMLQILVCISKGYCVYLLHIRSRSIYCKF